jgi:uncharacterized membrane protein YdjX (TVP38/TMEM64 family)
VIASALGSLAGVVIVDVIMRNAGERGLKRFVSAERVTQLKAKMNKGAGWLVFTSTLLPPPFPFTPVVMTASALQTPRAKFYLAIVTGRLVRFTIEALLALYFGRQVLRFLNSSVLDYVVYGLAIVAVIGSILSVWKWLRHREKK